MGYSLKALTIVGLLLLSGSTLASTTTADFGDVNDPRNSRINQFNISVDGLDINVSGWSDTADLSTDVDKDSAIRRAKNLDKYRGGWALENFDEPYNYCGTNGHSADNFGTCGYKDYDFFLLSFSEAVSLVNATYSWVAGNNVEQNQVSVAALESSLFTNTDGLDNNTWKNIANNHTIRSDFAQITDNPTLGYLTTFNGNTDEIYSTHWLIGALNNNFGGKAAWEGDDGMKLSGVSFNKRNLTPAQVPEPSSLAMLLIGLIALLRFNRQRV